MTMRLRLAITGNLEQNMAVERAAIASGIRRAADKRSRALQLAARNEVNTRFTGSQRVRGGRRVGNAIRRRLYFNDGPYKAAAQVFSKFGRRGPEGFLDYLAPYVLGATLRPRSGKFLFIPVNRNRGARSRLRRNRREFGQLSGRNTEVIPTKNPGVFVVVRKIKSRTTLIGWLVRRIRIRPRINFAAIVQREIQAFPAAVLAEIEEAAGKAVVTGGTISVPLAIGGLDRAA